MKRPQRFTPNRGTGGFKFDGTAHITAMYDNDWKKYRARFLEVNPLCYSCGALATVVDHVEPHKGDKAIFERLDNHIPLCEKCHNYITAKFDKFHKPGKLVISKLEWMYKNRARNELTIRVKVLPSYR